MTAKSYDDLVYERAQMDVRRVEIRRQIDALSNRRLSREEVRHAAELRVEFETLGAQCQTLQADIARAKNAARARPKPQITKHQSEINLSAKLRALFAVASAADAWLYGDGDDDAGQDALEVAIAQLDAVMPDWRAKKKGEKRAPR